MLLVVVVGQHAASTCVGLGVDFAIDDDVADKRRVVLIDDLVVLVMLLVGEDLVVQGGGSWSWGVLRLEQACCGVGCLLLGV